MFRQHKMFHGMIGLGILGLLAASTPSQAEPSALDDKGSSATKDQPTKERPKEKNAIIVPAGTSLMVTTSEKVSSHDKPGRRFSATLEANLLSGDVVVAESGSQVYGQVQSSNEIDRGTDPRRSDLVLTLTDINVEGTMYPITTGSFSEQSTSLIFKKRSVVVPSGSLLEFKLTLPLTVKK